MLNFRMMVGALALAFTLGTSGMALAHHDKGSHAGGGGGSGGGDACDGGCGGVGNGFPSGPHFNLNLLGKKDNFLCPSADAYQFSWTDTVTEESCDPDKDTAGTCTDRGDPKGRNVIFMPRQTDNPDEPGTFGDIIEIELQSGRKGSKKNPESTVLEVTDWCTNSFPNGTDTEPGIASGPGDTGDMAEFGLPPDPEGYAVYARVHGKPSKGDGVSPFLEFITGQLTLVEDEFGNDLLGLGLVTSGGTFTLDGEELVRNDTSRKGKKVLPAVNISDFFTFTGDLCFINDDSIDTFCPDFLDTNPEDCELRTVLTDSGETFDQPVCCVGANLAPNGDVVLADDAENDCSNVDGFAFCGNSSIVEILGDEDNTDEIGNNDGIVDELLGDEDNTDGIGNDDGIVDELLGDDDDACGSDLDCVGNEDGICDAGEACEPAVGNEDGICDAGEACEPAIGNEDGTCDAGEACATSCPDTITTFEDPNNGIGDDGELIGDGNCDEGEDCVVVSNNDEEGTFLCEPVPVCRAFTDQWIFNLEAFVNALFGIENNGTYNVQLRFYPLSTTTFEE